MNRKENGFHPFTESEIKKIIRGLQKGIREDRKLIKFCELFEKKYPPFLIETKKITLKAIERYTKEIEEWKEEIENIKRDSK